MVAASVLPSPVFISAIFPSGNRSSRLSPPANLSRNSSVFCRRSASESFSISGSNAETASTRCWRTLTLRPSPILKIFVNKFAKTSYLVVVSGLTGLTSRLYEPIVSVTTPVYHIYITGIGAREHVEVVVEELQLEDSLLGTHRLHLELLGPYYARLEFLFFLHDERLRRLGDCIRRILQVALPAVDLAPPEALDLPFELIRHPVYGSIHVF